MRPVIFALAICLSLVGTSAKSKTGSSQTQAQAELDALITSYVKPYCQSIKGDEQAFEFATLPYGPLDLQVENASGLKETLSWKGFYLGIVGAAAEVDVLAINNRFHCGQACDENRKAYLVKKLPEITMLVRNFYAVPQLNLIANWGLKDEYRINNVFHMSGQTREAVPSPVMGFVPSGRWKELKDTEQPLNDIKLSKAKFDSLLTALRDLKLAAVVRNKEGYIKVVLAGIGNNEAGLVFHQNFFRKPIINAMVISRSFDSEHYMLEVVGPGVIFYQKSGS